MTQHTFASRLTRRTAVPLAGIGIALVLGAFALLMSGDGGPSGAFADAPAGEYAVVARPAGEAADEIVAVPADDPEGEIVVATVDRLPGYSPDGRVSPDGTRLALVVPDGGTQAQPTASLVVVDLLDGTLTRVAQDIELPQQPLWSDDAAAVLATRRGMDGSVALERHDLEDGSTTTVLSLDDVFGIYPVGYQPDGTLVTVALDGRGSTAYMDTEPALDLAPGFTRDWALDPDGERLAYIEVLTDGGVSYEPRTVSLLGGSGGARTQELREGQALGAAWAPDGGAHFGNEPGGAWGGNAQAQQAIDGFDVPLDYSSEGVLAVEHYDGESFEEPGARQIQIVRDAARRDIGEAAEFYGWVTR